jgi:hypothetical protein
MCQHYHQRTSHLFAPVRNAATTEADPVVGILKKNEGNIEDHSLKPVTAVEEVVGATFQLVSQAHPSPHPQNDDAENLTKQTRQHDSIGAFVANMRMNFQLDNIENGSNKVHFAAGHSGMTLKDAEESASLNSVDVDECQGQDNSRMVEERRRTDLIKMVAGSPPQKVCVPQLEVPIIIDNEATMSRSYIGTSVMQNLSGIDISGANNGLISLVDGSAKKELDNIITEMEMKSISGKRKSVPFADQMNKRTKKEHTTCSPSQKCRCL